MNLKETLYSNDDASVNFIFDNSLEARYVRREDDYFIIYVSSHRGCDRACRFCWLTQSGQTDATSATITEMIEQIKVVRNYYSAQVAAGLQARAKVVHINFMARGELLLNEHIKGSGWMSLMKSIRQTLADAGLYDYKINISTIMPDVPEIYPAVGSLTALRYWLGSKDHVSIYYSLYSLDEQFRKRWLPKAMEPSKALETLRAWQAVNPSYHKVVFHWALIEGCNDSTKDATDIAKTIEATGINAKFNLVRYNPYSSAQGTEPSEQVLSEYFGIVSSVMRTKGSRIIPRVGFDVAASCGCFIEVTKALLTSGPDIQSPNGLRKAIMLTKES